MKRIPYKSCVDNTATDKVIRMLAAIPMPLIILAAIIIGGAWGWALAS